MFLLLRIAVDSVFILLILLSWGTHLEAVSHGEDPPEGKKSLTREAVARRAKAGASKFTRLFLTVECPVMASELATRCVLLTRCILSCLMVHMFIVYTKTIRALRANRRLTLHDRFLWLHIRIFCRTIRRHIPAKDSMSIMRRHLPLNSLLLDPRSQRPSSLLRSSLRLSKHKLDDQFFR